MVDFKGLSVGIIAGVFASGAYYFDGPWDPQLLLFLGLTWGFAGWVTTRNRFVLKNANNGPQVLFVLLVVGVPQFGIHSGLPLGGLRSTLGLLAMGVAISGIGLGAEMSESTNEEKNATVTPAD